MVVLTALTGKKKRRGKDEGLEPVSPLFGLVMGFFGALLIAADQPHDVTRDHSFVYFHVWTHVVGVRGCRSSSSRRVQ